jgi:hypothetical protein
MNIKSDLRLDNPTPVKGYLATMEEGDTAKFYILPHVSLKNEDGLAYNTKRDVAVVKGTTVIFLTLEHEFGNPDLFVPGQLVCVDKHVQGYTVKKSIGKQIYAFTYKKTEFTLGQSILVTATVKTGKTTTLTALCRAHSNVINSFSKRCTFGERMEDRLYASDEVDETVDCDSSAPIGVQYTRLMGALALSLDAAHSGKNALFALDSMTRLIMSLTGLFSDSHMVSGGIGHEVTDMVANLLRLGGKYGNGTLTVIGTCLFSSSNNTWKSIYDVLSAGADGEVKILRLSKGLAFDVNTRRPPEVSYPYITIFGEKIYY